MKLNIKKGSTVQITAGADKGKKGEVIEVFPKTLKVKVQGVKIETHFDKKDGLKKLEGLVDYSNVKLLSAPETKAKKTAKKKSASKTS